MRRMEIFSWFGFTSSITLWVTVKGREICVCDSIRSWYNFLPPQHDDLARSLRRTVYTHLVSMYQDLNELICIAPNLERVVILGNGDSSYGLHRSAFIVSKDRSGHLYDPWRRGAVSLSSHIELDVRGNSTGKDHTQVFLPVPQALLTPRVEFEDIDSGTMGGIQTMIEFLEAIKVPLLSVSLWADILPHITPPTFAKLQATGNLRIVMFLMDVGDLASFLHLQDSINSMNKEHSGNFELSFRGGLDHEIPSLSRLNLQPLTSFDGPAKMLHHIIPFGDNIKAIKIIDSLWIDDTTYRLLKSNPMKQVYYANLPFVDVWQQGHKVLEVWPSMKELYIRCECWARVPLVARAGQKITIHDVLEAHSNFPQVEVIHLNCRRCWSLNASMASNLETVAHRRTSALRVIEFGDHSIGYWNSLEHVWELEVNSCRGRKVRGYFDQEEEAAAKEMYRNCLTTWRSTLPRPSANQRILSPFKKLFGKPPLWEPVTV
ncbi:hypothetical protein M422DRAFT_257636 [Sphaerobolus stellatus SS14]|uniref:Uncharacterized protein n=1 Tax=Sphaerobolus stellatus (strain SS14) TaxID=990650 RepID=A0A0C9VDU4_SPHS4|nr:hypothetical protein M422DRAFT_257636 [Sphaerobolus stellatus SS14]